MSYSYKMMHEQSSERAQALFRKASQYRLESHADYALGCERKALRWLEHSYWLRTLDMQPPPYPWISSAYTPRLAR